MKTKLFKGQILIEILVAVTIFAFLAISIYGLIAVTRKTGRNSIQKMQAQNFVQEGIEKVRSIRDFNLKSGSDYDAGMNDGTYTVLPDADPNRFHLVSVLDTNNELGNGFIRNITIDDDATTGIMTVTVEVTWNNGASKEGAVTYLTNWKKL